MSLKERKAKMSLLFIEKAEDIAQRSPKTRAQVIIELQEIDKKITDSLREIGFCEKFKLPSVSAVIGTIELKPENVSAIKAMLKTRKIAAIRPLTVMENLRFGSKR